MSSPPRPTLAHDLAIRAERHGDRLAVRFTAGDDEWSELTYAGLAARAAALARLLRTKRAAGSVTEDDEDERSAGAEPQFVLLMLPNSLEYVVSFYGCLVGGAVAVTFYPPAVLTARTAKVFGERLRQIMQDCGPSVIILPGELVDFVREQLADVPEAAGVTFLAAGDLPEPAPGERIGRLDVRPTDLALLQYTSGSTSRPRGVMVSHGNLMHNVISNGARLRIGEGESVTSWLPIFHDMGLIGAVLYPIGAGMTLHLTTPVAFVRRPFLWLDIASRSRSSLIMGPNFAYDLCTRWITEEQAATLDLSSVRAAICGAEPVRHTTLDAFLEKFGPRGFHPGAMNPAYGMAEATLCISMSGTPAVPSRLEVSAEKLRRDRIAVPPDADELGAVLVGCGTDFAADTESVIVDPDRLVAVPDGHVGEIWATGPSVAQGYWGLPELSEQTFAAELPGDGRQFLRTGDLGVKIDGVVYVVGRIKDVIIQHGVNHYPQDVEFTAENAHPALRPGGVAVFTVPDGADGERVVLLCELNSYGSSVQPDSVLMAVRTAVAEEHGLEVPVAALVRKGQIPKTTSGKVRRRASAERWIAGGFDTVAEFPAKRKVLTPA